MKIRIGDDLRSRMDRLGLNAADLREAFARSSGPGGQHVNKTSTAVEMVHLPTGVAATASDSRSQAANRRLALERLVEKLELRLAAERQARAAAAARLRRQRARRSAATKREMAEQKRRRSEIKARRKKIAF